MKDNNDPQTVGETILGLTAAGVSVLAAADAVLGIPRSDHRSTLTSAPESVNLNGDLEADVTPEDGPPDAPIYSEYMD